MLSEKVVSSQLGGGNFQEASQFQFGTVPNSVYADDSSTPLCGK